MKVTGWRASGPGGPMTREEWEAVPGPGEVLVEVSGCGVCHTDLGFLYEGIPTKRPFPIVLGHEISGLVAETGRGAEAWTGRRVIVPSVIPCGECAACCAGSGSICARQIFPGNDVDGGFATHVCVPARGLCPVPDLEDRGLNPAGLRLDSLAVVADAVSTPYQAILRSGLGRGDLAVFVGVGGVGGFGVQIAAALGAAVAAVDVRAERLALVERHGAGLALDAERLDFKDLRAAVASFAERLGVPSWRRRVFETSGTPRGQTSAFGLLGPGGHLSVVGYTPRRIEIRLSNLMALDATARGNWGCLPEHYPAVLDLVLSGKVAIEPFVETRPLSAINATFADVREGRTTRRVILRPES
jgi:6-hydroxycyclohex-1-ene-1-carbonyl-CoA dehydrogenase